MSCAQLVLKVQQVSSLFSLLAAIWVHGFGGYVELASQGFQFQLCSSIQAANVSLHSSLTVDDGVRGSHRYLKR